MPYFDSLLESHKQFRRLVKKERRRQKRQEAAKKREQEELEGKIKLSTGQLALTIKKLLVDQHANRTLRVVCGILTIIKPCFSVCQFSVFMARHFHFEVMTLFLVLCRKVENRK